MFSECEQDKNVSALWDKYLSADKQDWFILEHNLQNLNEGKSGSRCVAADLSVKCIHPRTHSAEPQHKTSYMHETIFMSILKYKLMETAKFENNVLNFTKKGFYACLRWVWPFFETHLTALTDYSVRMFNQVIGILDEASELLPIRLVTAGGKDYTQRAYWVH